MDFFSANISVEFTQHLSTPSIPVLLLLIKLLLFQPVKDTLFNKAAKVLASTGALDEVDTTNDDDDASPLKRARISTQLPGDRSIPIWSSEEDLSKEAKLVFENLLHGSGTFAEDFADFKSQHAKLFSGGQIDDDNEYDNEYGYDIEYTMTELITESFAIAVQRLLPGNNNEIGVRLVVEHGGIGYEADEGAEETMWRLVYGAATTGGGGLAVLPGLFNVNVPWGAKLTKIPKIDNEDEAREQFALVCAALGLTTEGEADYHLVTVADGQ